MTASNLSSDTYLNGVVAKYRSNEAAAKAQVDVIYPTIQTWAGKYLTEAIYSGSIAKGTAISLATDADVFLSLSSITPDTLSVIYDSLYNALTQAGYQARKQNVSIGVSAAGYHLDFVPGKRQSQYGYDHSLYKNKLGTWTKTDVKAHVSQVTNSRRLGEIKLAKIWRELHQLEFPSFYLELVVIDCLSGRSYTALADNFWEVLGFLGSSFVNRRYVDPANTNNVISDDLPPAGKQTIELAATISRSKKNWSEIVW